MTIRVLAVGNNNVNQADHRSLVASFAQPNSGTTHKSGLFPTNSAADITNVSAMQVKVGPFKAIVPNTNSVGSYLVQSDADITLTFDAGEAAVARTDRIIVRVYNNAADGSGRDEAVVEYLKGQSSGSASALPASSLLLFEFPVPAGASAGTGGINFTGIVQDKRLYTTASGGIIPVDHPTTFDVPNPYRGQAIWNRSTDILYIYDGTSWRARNVPAVDTYAGLASNILNPYEGLVAYVRDVDLLYVYENSAWRIKGTVSAASFSALSSLSGATEGLIGFTRDTNRMYIHDGTNWQPQPIIKTGTASTNTGVFVTVNFGYTFPSVPIVHVTADSGSGAQVGPTAMVTNRTTTSFQVRMDVEAGTTGLNVPIMWTAIA